MLVPRWGQINIVFPCWFNFSRFCKRSRSLYILNLSILCMTVKAKKKKEVGISKSSEKKNRQISWGKNRQKKAKFIKAYRGM